MNILLVDDSAITLDLLSMILLDKGHRVRTAPDGAKACVLLREEPAHIVLTDWMMPVMDGPALCRWIRSHHFPWYIYIILITMRNQIEDIVAGLASGADDFLKKPVDPAELEARIKTGERILSLESRYIAIFALAKLAESRDPETGRHLERICEYVRILGNHMIQRNGTPPPITEKEIEMLCQTAPLHDIGKVGIPDSILLKPERLNDAEYEIMKTHTLIGGETLDTTIKQFPGTEFLNMARDIALTHHERFDGTGYPRGLRADAIPLCGRIVALADVYDAITAKRVYKTAQPHNVARSIIINEMGKQFDPHVVDAFLAGEEEFIECWNRLADIRQEDFQQVMAL